MPRSSPTGVAARLLSPVSMTGRTRPRRATRRGPATASGRGFVAHGDQAGDWRLPATSTETLLPSSLSAAASVVLRLRQRNARFNRSLCRAEEQRPRPPTMPVHTLAAEQRFGAHGRRGIGRLVSFGPCKNRAQPADGWSRLPAPRRERRTRSFVAGATDDDR